MQNVKGYEVERELLDVNDLCVCLGIGKTTAYKLLNSEDFPTVRIGRMQISQSLTNGLRVCRKEKGKTEMNDLRFDYYYGTEADQFSFYRVPRLLIKDKRFSKLSSDAKLLYGLMLDRMSLSMKNQWLDKENRAYIIYRVEDVAEDLGVCRETAIKIMAELDYKKGMGLIEKKKMGLGRPDIIYVKNFVGAEMIEHKEPSTPVTITEVEKFNFKKSEKPTSRSGKKLIQEMEKIHYRYSDNSTSIGGESSPLAVEEVDPNYINNNYTENSYTNPIYLSQQEDENGMDGNTQYALYEKIIKENIEYDYLEVPFK